MSTLELNSFIRSRHPPGECISDPWEIINQLKADIRLLANEIEQLKAPQSSIEPQLMAFLNRLRELRALITAPLVGE